MNKLALLVALALTSIATMAAAPSGTFSVVNIENVTDAAAKPIYWLTSGTLAPASSSTFVEVLGGPVGGTLAPLMDSTGAPVITTMGTGGSDGTFFVGGGLIPGTTGGPLVELQVVAWTGSANYTDAGVTFIGKSATFTQNNATSWNSAAVPPAPIDGPGLSMPAFTITAAVVPEPSTIALGLLGAAGLLLRRRS